MKFIAETVASMDPVASRDKTSNEKTKLGEQVMSPKTMNDHFKTCFEARGYSSCRLVTYNSDDPDVQIRAREIPVDERAAFFATSDVPVKKGFTECDFVGHFNGVEVQFGKYSFVEEDKERLFEFMDLEIVTTGAIIIPMRSLLAEMSTGPSNWQTVTNKWLRRRLDQRSPHPIAVFGIDYVR